MVVGRCVLSGDCCSFVGVCLLLIVCGCLLFVVLVVCRFLFLSSCFLCAVYCEMSADTYVVRLRHGVGDCCLLCVCCCLLLLVVRCLLRGLYCLFVVSRLLLLCVGCWYLIVWCLLYVVCPLSCAACYLVSNVRCVLVTGHCLLAVNVVVCCLVVGC